MQDFKQEIDRYGARDLEQRKHWYSPAAEAYHRARPRYPQALIQQVFEIAQLSRHSKILEVGCGPATATTAIAQLGCPTLALEPNPAFYRLAQQNCIPYPNVELLNTSFEEWIPDTEPFDAVIAASSFHWIPAAVGYPKAARILSEQGYLILLWNKELQPTEAVYQHLQAVYQRHAPALARYETQAEQEEILRKLGQLMMDSGYFQTVITEQVKVEVTYTVDDYLTLLNTYSPYLKLEPSIQKSLFAELRETITQISGNTLDLSYLSAFHIASKNPTASQNE
ncbi:MAG: methyltransferase domain-containing protein [Scytolyngbya sp. HA4215-MV1]|jgi:SAM-dependent methyltransferase|nr:methyltransferase domain-containing protein [Scytolyngbya sp. HA4215-MV1]